jgi:hypothetical protein
MGLSAVASRRQKAWWLVWDNASWHISAEVRGWFRQHNRWAQQANGVPLIVCQLPVKSPWLNPIERGYVDDLSMAQDRPKPRVIHPPQLGGVIELPRVAGLHNHDEQDAA